MKGREGWEGVPALRKLCAARGTEIEERKRGRGKGGEWPALHAFLPHVA